MFSKDIEWNIDNPTVNKFQPFAHRKMGMQFSGQVSWHGYTSRPFIKNANYYLHVWFWTCDITDPFVILSLQTTLEGSTWPDTSLPIFRDVTDDSVGQGPLLTLGMQGDGFVFLDTRI